MPQKRRYTIHVAAVMDILNRQKNLSWSAQDVADQCDLAYGTAYAILQRLFRTGLVARIETGDEGEGIGHTRVWYETSPAGKRLHRSLKQHVPDPVGALKAFIIEEDE